MNNDFDRMNEFIQKIKSMSIANINVNANNVYANLVRIGINDDIKIDDFHNLWIEEFKDIANINVFVDSKAPYYCHFNNGDNTKIDPYKMIKMYISQDREHIYEAVNKIFKYMALNNICHHSKVSSQIRNDSIVIRVYDMADALKIQEFIMNDSYIMEGVIASNPFTCNNGSVAYAWDGHLFYFEIVASYISGYINKLKDSNKLDTASFKNFLEYLDDCYDYGFVKNKNIMKNLDVPKNLATTMAEYYDDFKQISKMLLVNLSSKDKDIDDFYHNYNKIILNTIRNNLGKDISIYQEMWNNIYKRLVKIYGYKFADFRVLSFIISDNYAWFTRKDNIREYMINNGIKASLLKILIANMSEKREHMKMLYEALRDTYKKYDFKQTHEALKKAILGNYDLITNSRNGRTKLKNKVDYREINGIMAYELLKREIITDKMLLDENLVINKYLELITGGKVDLNE